MNLKAAIRDARIDDLLGFKVRRGGRGIGRVVFPALAVAGAAAIGWAIRLAAKPRIAARRMHRSIKAKARMTNGRSAAAKIGRKATVAAHAHH